MESRRNRRSNHGITLIALVISIIVMLILAGVSINAIVGDDGILSRTQYSTFLSEMTAVEEVVQMWKAGEAIGQMGEETKAIPANGLCKVSDLTKTERLAGEVGYYRIWSMTETAPITSVLSSADIFNTNFESELMYYPAGVQDLFYLNNEVLGIESDKTYVIDAATGMIYSMAGVKLKGVSCYSSNMATAVMSGTLNAPIFAESEVSGTGTDDKLAGNKEHEYGFEIISDQTNNNVYKLYNNGDLYGKGLKGTLLGTSESEMENINSYVWSELTIPTQIGSYKEIIAGNNIIFVIDNNNDLWAWGSNDSNRLGLTQEQQIEYTGREPVKLNIDEKKVEKVFSVNNSTFVLTTENELYASGYNEKGQLGTGEMINSSNSFKKVKFEHPENITKITYIRDCIVIFCGTGANTKIYFAGSTIYGFVPKLFVNTEYAGKDINNFIEIGNGIIGVKPPVNMKYYCYPSNEREPIYALGEDGNLYRWEFNQYVKVELDANSGKITDIKSGSPGAMVIRKELSNGDVQFWGYSTYDGSDYYFDFLEEHETFYLLNDMFPSGYNAKDIKDFNFDIGKSVLFLSKSGKIFGSGYNTGLGINETSGVSSSFIDISKVSNISDTFVEFIDAKYSNYNGIILKASNGKMYMTNAPDIVFRENRLQKNWTKIASNVKKFNATTNSNCIAYIDNNNDIWVAGEDSYVLGLNSSGDVEKVSNFVLLKDYLKGQEIYEHINGKVKDFCFATKTLYILTNEEDNNTLYVSGHYLSYGWTPYSYIGTGLEEHAKIPTKIFDKVEDIYMANLERMAVRKENGKFELYTWGCADGAAIPRRSLVPVKWNDGDTAFADAIEVNLWEISYDKSYIGIKKNNSYDLRVCGRHGYGDTVNGLGMTVYTYTSIPYENQNIVKNCVAAGHGTTFMFLTEKGELFGFGKRSTLGIGTTDTTSEPKPIKLSVNDSNGTECEVDSITAGNGFYIAITKDGRVFGTGNNNYGVLGRWIGIDRKQPNSRYKTAFEWVECPELEI
ncbi:MAG: hypothetical protein OSJ66_03150 [Clostridia bacterium]|nr:hypothetical protein [Clostridia bacterium]